MTPSDSPQLDGSDAGLHDRIEQQGLGVSYQITLGNRFRANGGVLYSNYEKRFTDDTGSATSSESAPWLYNLGAAVRLTDHWELYGSCSRGLEEAGTAPPTATNANTVLEATIATQRELGLRYAIHPELTLILAGFDTRKPQTGIDAWTGAFEFIGDVTHRGIEASLSGALTSTLTTVLGAVYTDAAVSGINIDSGRIGSRPVNVPTWRAIANLNYQLNARFSADIGVEYLGQRAALSRAQGGTDSQLLLTGSTVVDIGVRYRIQTFEVPTTIRAQMLNVFDEFSRRSAPGETLDYTPQRSLRLLLTAEF